MMLDSPSKKDRVRSSRSPRRSRTRAARCAKLLSLLSVPTPYAKAVPTGWHGNWTSSWGASTERTSISWNGGNHIIAYNSVQKWSPARGTTNGSTCEVLFGTALVRGALSRDGSTIVWDNGSKWFREGS